MTLKFYPEPSSSNPFSINGNISNPVRHSFNGRAGGVVEVRYYLRNDDNTKTYTSITIVPVDPSGRNIVNGTDGYSWKMKAGDTKPTAQEWATTSAANTVSMSNLTDIQTYLPFWVRIEVPAGAPVESFEDVYFLISATENAV